MTPNTAPRPHVSAIAGAWPAPGTSSRHVVKPAYLSPGPPGHSAARTAEPTPSAATTRSARNCPAEVTTCPDEDTEETAVDSASTPSGIRVSSRLTSADRGNRMTGSPNRSLTTVAELARISHRPSARRTPIVCAIACLRASSPRPRTSSARSPFGARASPDPTGSTDAARSKTFTSHPAAHSPAAAVSPPIPAPITTAAGRALTSPMSALPSPRRVASWSGCPRIVLSR
jgi:hypothetical protein